MLLHRVRNSRAETAEKFTKVAPTFPVSHVSTNWEDNLKLMGELTGKKR